MKRAKDIRHNLKFYEDIHLPIKMPCIGYVLNGGALGDSWDTIVVLINPTKHKKHFALPAGNFNISVEDFRVSLNTPLARVKGEVEVPAASLMVLYKN